MVKMVRTVRMENPVFRENRVLKLLLSKEYLT